MRVPIAQIRSNPFQVRQRTDRASIQALADEIKELGFWGSLRARRAGAHFEIVFGHRRLEALRLLKIAEIDLEVVALSDDEMATQSAVENLQREGLTDIEKAQTIKMLVGRFESRGERNLRARQHVAALLGYGLPWLNDILGVLDHQPENRKLIAAGKISGKVANEAHRIGGDEMVRTAAEKRIPLHTLTKIGQELNRIPEPAIREKVKRAVLSGKAVDADQVRARSRAVRREATPKVPPDLRLVIRQWTQTMNAWTRQLDAVLPYLDYVEADTATAGPFKDATRSLIEKLRRFL